MLAHAPHRHNPDARIGDEDLIGGKQLVERRRALLAAAMPSAAHSRSTMPRMTPATPQRSSARRQQPRPRARRTHCSSRREITLSGRIEQQRIEDAMRGRASAAASTFSSRLRCLMPASAGFSPSRNRRDAQHRRPRRSSLGSAGVGPQRQQAARRTRALRRVAAPRALPRVTMILRMARGGASATAARDLRAQLAASASKRNAEARAARAQAAPGARREIARCPRARSMVSNKPSP